MLILNNLQFPKPTFPRSERTVKTEDVVLGQTVVLVYTDILGNIVRLITELDHVTGKRNIRLFCTFSIISVKK